MLTWKIAFKSKRFIFPSPLNVLGFLRSSFFLNLVEVRQERGGAYVWEVAQFSNSVKKSSFLIFFFYAFLISILLVKLLVLVLFFICSNVALPQLFPSLNWHRERQNAVDLSVVIKERVTENSFWLSSNNRSRICSFTIKPRGYSFHHSQITINSRKKVKPYYVKYLFVAFGFQVRNFKTVTTKISEIVFFPPSSSEMKWDLTLSRQSSAEIPVKWLLSENMSLNYARLWWIPICFAFLSLHNRQSRVIYSEY